MCKWELRQVGHIRITVSYLAGSGTRTEAKSSVRNLRLETRRQRCLIVTGNFLPFNLFETDGK
jgi:hypothetical protein